MKPAPYYFKIQATLGIAVIALAASLAPLPSIEAARGGGSIGGGRVGGGGGGIGIGVGEVVGGLVINLVANYIYDAAGNKVRVNPPMNGQITATPTVEAYGGFRMTQTINGYAHDGLRPDLGGDRDPGYNDDKWTEYFDVDYGEVVDNPDYDPDAEPGEANSRKYILPSSGEFNDHGDKFKSRSTMEKEYSTAEYGYVYDDDGRRHMQFSKKGRWVYVGESERIKCSHRLLSEVTVGDNRLALNQKYKAKVRYRLAYVSWHKKDEEFKVWAYGGWQKDPHTLSATSSGRKRITILKRKNTEIYELEEKGSSQLWWKGRAVKPWLAKNYIVWEPEQHDELNSK